MRWPQRAVVAAILAVGLVFRLFESEDHTVKTLTRHNAELLHAKEQLELELAALKMREAAELQQWQANTTAMQAELSRSQAAVQSMQAAHAAVQRAEHMRDPQQRPPAAPGADPPPPPPPPPPRGGEPVGCTVHENQDLPGYDLTEVELGAPDIGQCCDSCTISAECHLAVLCGRSCWLKTKSLSDSVQPHAKRGCIKTTF